MYDTKAVANYLLDLANRSSKTLDPMQIQKLVYFAHGWNLALSGDPLIDDVVQAWQFGPVIPTLYHEFKSFGNNPITRKASHLVMLDTDKLEFVDPCLDGGPDAKMTRDLLEMIWVFYGKLSGIQLSNMTHEVGTPWYETWKGANGRKSIAIPDELIRTYFLALLNDN